MNTGARRRRLFFPIFSFQFSFCILQFLFLLLLASLAFASGSPPSSGDRPRDSLTSEADDDYNRALLGDSARPDGKGRADDQLPKRLQGELGSAAQREDRPEDPLLRVAKEMREVQQRIGQHDSGRVTQHVQQQIVAGLAELIEQAKKAGPGNNPNNRRPSGSSTRSPQDPAQASGNSPAPAQESNAKIRKPEELRAEAARKAGEWMKREWSRMELQLREHEQMIVEPSEHFLPGYELEIEDYFRRLSEDQPDLERP